MSDQKKYVQERKKRDKPFAEGYDEGYEQFKLVVELKQARESAGLTQEELVRRLNIKKTAISRIEKLCRGYQTVNFGESGPRPWQAARSKNSLKKLAAV